VIVKTNLSTRPFYNERAVQVVLGGIFVLVIALSAFNAIRLLTLSGSQSRLGAHASDAEAQAARLKAQAAQIRGRINTKELETVAIAAREANSIIDRRAFSWTELFTEFERTLPDDVRITAVQPQLEKDVFSVALIVEGRRVEDLDAFVEALEKKGSFRNVLTTQEQTDEGGLIRATIEGIYTPRSRDAAEASRE
jgi:hypothetical protein